MPLTIAEYVLIGLGGYVGYLYYNGSSSNGGRRPRTSPYEVSSIYPQPKSEYSLYVNDDTSLPSGTRLLTSEFAVGEIQTQDQLINEAPVYNTLKGSTQPPNLSETFNLYGKRPLFKPATGSYYAGYGKGSYYGGYGEGKDLVNE